MKSELTINAGRSTAGTEARQAGTARGTARRMLTAVAAYYSKALGREVSLRQTLLLANAQAAFFMTVFPADCPLPARAACAVWLVSALLKCRRSLLRTSC